MQLAKNYNSFIANQILSLVPDDTQIKAYDFGAGTGQFTSVTFARPKILSPS